MITGASRGLGSGIAEGIHETGAEIAIIDVSEDVEATVREMGTTSTKVYAVKGDLGNRAQKASPL